jgi:hypothetical protein
VRYLEVPLRSRTNLLPTTIYCPLVQWQDSRFWICLSGFESLGGSQCPCGFGAVRLLESSPMSWWCPIFCGPLTPKTGTPLGHRRTFYSTWRLLGRDDREYGFETGSPEGGRVSARSAVLVPYLALGAVALPVCRLLPLSLRKSRLDAWPSGAFHRFAQFPGRLPILPQDTHVLCWSDVAGFEDMRYTVS